MRLHGDALSRISAADTWDDLLRLVEEEARFDGLTDTAATVEMARRVAQEEPPPDEEDEV